MVKKIFLCALLFVGKVYGIIDIGIHSQSVVPHGLPKKQNEDNYVIVTKACSGKIDLLMGVFDGHGGNYVSAFAAQKLKDVVCESCSESSIDLILAKSIEQLNAQILQNPNLNFMGSTALIACVNNGELCVANVGGSRALFLHKDGSSWYTMDHKPCVNSEEGKRILSKDGAIVCEYRFLYDGFNYSIEKHSFLKKGEVVEGWFLDLHKKMCKLDAQDPVVQKLSSDKVKVEFAKQCNYFWEEYFVTDERTFKLAMSRSIGDKWCKNIGVISDPDIYSCAIKDLDYLILASNGLWDVMSPEEVVEYMKVNCTKCDNANAVCDKLVNRVIASGGKDDVTVGIVFFE